MVRFCRGARWGGALLAATIVTLAPLRGADEATWQAVVDAATAAEREGRLEDAERLLLEARSEAHKDGAARMLLALSIENLAGFYYRSARPGEAEPLYVESIELWDAILGPDQPRVGIALHNLAVLFLDDCRVEAALPLIDRVAELWGATLGPDHPDRVTALRTEATLLRRCDRPEEASELEARGPAAGREIRPRP